VEDGVAKVQMVTADGAMTSQASLNALVTAIAVQVERYARRMSS